MKTISILITFVAGLFILSCNSDSSQNNFKSEKENITVTEASALLRGNALLIDVREPDELAVQSYDVKNCINIPLDSLESKIDSIPKDKQVILACQRGGRSQKAFDLLKSKGFTNIANMEGGMNAWSEAGFPTKTGITAMKACCANPNSKDCKYDANGKCVGDNKTCCSKTDTKTSSINTTTKNHLEVYAFHGTRQCETCKNMKANTKATLEKYFSEQLKNGSIVFSIIDVDDVKNEKLAEKFQATGTALMINNVVNGKETITDWSDFAFDKANDESKFIPELKTLIDGELKKQNGNTSSIN